MSTLSITFELQALDFSPLTRGQVVVVFNDGTQDLSLPLSLTTSVPTVGFFQEVPWVGGAGEEVNNSQQASNFANAFNRDYKNIGGTKNLSASVTGDVVTINAKKGIFKDGVGESRYTGNVIIVSGITANNTVQPSPISLSVTMTNTGDCNTITYSAIASGASGTYTLKTNTGTIQTGWNGSALTFQLARGVVRYVRVSDDGDLSEFNVNIVVPRKLADGDFSIQTTGFEDGTDVVVNTNTVIAGTSPLEYSLDALSASTGTNYVSVNSFAAVQAGQYKLFVRDRFGCEIFKIINVSAFQDGIETDSLGYFQIEDGQSIIFTEFVDFNDQTKKNYFNTGSYNEAILGNRFRAKHEFTANDGFQGTQIKSSYPYHAVTLHRKNGVMVDIPLIMISENLGILEKMDCVRFRLTETTTGVYFNGGNTYIPNTTTVLGTNTFVGTTPSWAKIGQLIRLDGVALRITGTGYNNLFGWYFIVDAVTATTSTATVQLVYNKQLYNTFEFYLDTSIIQPCDVIVVEKGYGPDLYVGNPWVSERIYPLVDNDEYLLIKWSDTKNKSNIVFQSGISFMARLKGEFVPDSDDSSETFSGDSNEYSIEQIRRLNFEVIIEGLTFKQVMQMNIASALSGFSVNSLNLVCKSAPEKNRANKSNLWTWKGKFAFGENMVAIQQDEIVLSVGTGVVGGGGTGKTFATDLSSITIYRDLVGNIVTYPNGVIAKQ